VLKAQSMGALQRWAAGSAERADERSMGSIQRKKPRNHPMPRAPARSPAVGPAHFHAAPQAPLMPSCPRARDTPDAPKAPQTPTTRAVTPS